MKRIRAILIVGLLSAIAMSISCKKDSPPEPPIGPKPGKREYVWTVDTITYPGSYQIGMRSIYGTSNDNIYIVGHNDQNRGKMYRFDGHRWSPIVLTASEGGPIQGAITLAAIDGRGPNDIWAVGEETYYDPLTRRISDSSLIIHYNGVQWAKAQIRHARRLQAVKAFDDGSVFAGGMYGSSYRYDGSQWHFVSADTNIWFSGFGYDGQNICGLAYTPGWLAGYYEIIYLLRWADPIWQIVDSVSITTSVSARFGHLGMGSFGSTVYSVGYGVFQKIGSRWDRISSIAGTYGVVRGTRAEHVFVVGDKVWHLNSENWQELQARGASTWGLSDVWCSEDEVFIVGSDALQSFVIHGK
jgi:hypothetical protein